MWIGIPTSEVGIRRAPIIPIFPGEKIAETGTGLLADPAVESKERNHGAAQLCPRFGAEKLVMPIPEVSII
jgi:hypothetical protein